MHEPSGRGTAEAIRRRAKPATLYSGVSGTQTKKGWRNTRDTQSEMVNVYVIFQEGQMTLEEDGETIKQWAVIYTLDKRLSTGQLLVLPEEFGILPEYLNENRRLIIRRTAQRPAANPRYYKAWGVQAN